MRKKENQSGNLWNYKRLEPYQPYVRCGFCLDPDSNKPILQTFMRQWGKFGHIAYLIIKNNLLASYFRFNRYHGYII